MLQDFFSRESARVVLGIRRRIAGLILSQGCRLLPLKFPPPQMKVAVGVEDGTQVFQLLNSSKLFWFAFQQLQVSGGRFPSLWALALHLSSHVCSFVAWQTCALSNKWILRSFCQFSGEWRRKVLTHLRVLTAHPAPFFKTVSISTIYCLIINTQRCSKHEISHGCYMIRVWISCSHNVLCSIKQFCFWLKLLSRWRRCSDFAVWPCVSV